MEILLQSLCKRTKLTEKELQPVMKLFIPLRATVGKQLLSPNEVASSIWFVGSGALRAYHHVEEQNRRNKIENSTILREATSWIVPEGGFLTDVKSFLYQVPATYYVETLELCKLYSLSHEKYLLIQRSHPEIAQSVFEHTLIMADFRVRLSSYRRPEDRLAIFQKTYPQMAGRLSVNILASYLNVDPTTLSRLRGKK